MNIHFVYAGEYYFWSREDELKTYILKGIEKYNIEKVMVTMMTMWRSGLISKERMENFYKGGNDFRRKSFNSDLDSFFRAIRLGKKPYKRIDTFYLPRLTVDELDLVERRDFNFMQTFLRECTCRDVHKSNMALSKSDSKFVDAYAVRKTFTIKNSLQEIDMQSSESFESSESLEFSESLQSSESLESSEVLQETDIKSSESIQSSESLNHLKHKRSQEPKIFNCCSLQ